MKKTIFAALLVLFSVAAIAQGLVTLNFNSMKMSDDQGKTWTETTKVEGKFTIDEAKKTLAMTLMDDTQTYKIIKKNDIDKDTFRLTCTMIETDGKDGETVQFQYSPKSKEAIFINGDHMISFTITAQSKK